MDSQRFDALTRQLGTRRSRRHTLQSLAAALMGLGIAQSAAAQVGVERATCGQTCTNSDDCNAGLRCSRPGSRDGICVAVADSRDSCSRNSDCDRNFEICRDRRCVNQSTCSRCNVSEDCPGGEVCRSGDCGGCDRDSQCPSREVCRNGRCEEDRDECRGNSDCRKKERCRNGRCVRRN